MSHMFCPTCQAECCMKVGASAPVTFYLDMVGQIGYTCRFCGTRGWGPGTSPGLICCYEPGPIAVELDGNMWCAKRPATFINLQESLAGFGTSRKNAVMELRRAEDQAVTEPRP
jgi:hypothetical protein